MTPCLFVLNFQKFVLVIVNPFIYSFFTIVFISLHTFFLFTTASLLPFMLVHCRAWKSWTWSTTTLRIFWQQVRSVFCCYCCNSCSCNSCSCCCCRRCCCAVIVAVTYFFAFLVNFVLVAIITGIEQCLELVRVNLSYNRIVKREELRAFEYVHAATSPICNFCFSDFVMLFIFSQTFASIILFPPLIFFWL